MKLALIAALLFLPLLSQAKDDSSEADTFIECANLYSLYLRNVAEKVSEAERENLMIDIGVASTLGKLLSSETYLARQANILLHEEYAKQETAAATESIDLYTTLFMLRLERCKTQIANGATRYQRELAELVAKQQRQSTEP
ncbi:MAG: hypothetical protein Q8J78_12910 [Moraxellaceae bacterium]|nr:hypothetical protein [Moraxellaceae bacterium]